eukprot:7389616-Prymnesium_polylepis.3
MDAWSTERLVISSAQIDSFSTATKSSGYLPSRNDPRSRGVRVRSKKQPVKLLSTILDLGSTKARVPADVAAGLRRWATEAMQYKCKPCGQEAEHCRVGGHSDEQ